MAHSDAVVAAANCPQCRALMVHVAIAPHPVVRNMQRNIYLCSPCNRTRTYMLPVAPASIDSVIGPVQPQLQRGHA